MTRDWNEGLSIVVLVVSDMALVDATVLGVVRLVEGSAGPAGRECPASGVGEVPSGRVSKGQCSTLGGQRTLCVSPSFAPNSLSSEPHIAL